MASMIEPLIPATPDQLAKLSKCLIDLGDRMPLGPDWVAVARAAAVLDGLALGLVQVVSSGEQHVGPAH